MKGFRTLAFNIGGAALIAALHAITGINWTDYVSPTSAVLIVMGANALLRLITTTSVGQKA